MAPECQEIKNPRRILILGDTDSGALPLLKRLTGSAPTPRELPKDDSSTHTIPTVLTSTAGLTHMVNLKNAYYSASIPIWLDETSAPNEWKIGFLSEEAGDVVRAVGAWVVVFRINSGEDARRHLLEMMRAIKAAISQAHEGDEDLWDGVCLAVGWPSGTIGKSGGEDAIGTARTMADEVQDWEDDCQQCGFEFIDGRRSHERDSNGEVGGVARVREALEANDWTSGEGDELGLLGEDEEMGDFQAGDEGDFGFGEEKRLLEKEFLSLKMDTSSAQSEPEPDEAFQLESFERLMSTLVAVRDATSHLPKEERKRAAAKAVNGLLKAT